MLNFSSSRGFTLLEGIIAIGVISVGLAGALSLALSNLSSAQGNERRIVAANLAREGIEFVRNQRDSNWLKVDLNKSQVNLSPYTWDTFINAAGNSVAPAFVPIVTPIAAPTANVPAGMSFAWSKVSLVGVTNDTCNDFDCMAACGSACQLYYDPVSYLYGVLDTTPNAILTPFHRLITTQEICYNDATNAELVKGLSEKCETDPTYSTKVGILATSIVRYDQAKKLDVVVKERLYNWR
jgi:prepilin-type N-terminal cleavage/methylation domain-containing protein